MNGTSGSDDWQALPRRLADGEPAAFAEAYDLYGGRLYRTAVRYLGCATEAEDVVQELFASMVRSRDQLRHVENLASYLFVSLRRLIGRFSRDRRQRARKTEPGVEAQDTNPDLALVELRESLQAALRQLPDDQRDVVILKIDSELTFAEISAVLQVSPNTVASRYRYAMEKLRRVLAGEELRNDR